MDFDKGIMDMVEGEMCRWNSFPQIHEAHRCHMDVTRGTWKSEGDFGKDVKKEIGCEKCCFDTKFEPMEMVHP